MTNSPYPLTETEATILAACLNDDTREGQLDDNYSNGGIEEFAAALPHLNQYELGGHVTNLIKRRLITSPDDESNGIIWITEDGVNAIFDHMERVAEDK